MRLVASASVWLAQRQHDVCKVTFFLQYVFMEEIGRHEMINMSGPSFQPILIIYSHGRNPPLQPPPDLKYDLRNIPNPPKALRTTSDGRSKRLREHLLAEPKFTQTLGRAVDEIRMAMDEKLAQIAQPSTQPGPDVGASSKSEDLRATPQEGNEERRSTSPDMPPDPDEILLRVGCNCALGHHRSVAFVEELARRDWPKDWQLQIVHRDLHEKKAGSTRVKQKAAFRREKSHMESMGATSS